MSDSDNIQREEDIFDLARRIESPDVRASYVSQACDGDADMEARVNELLEIHLTRDSLLDRPPVDIGPTLATPSSEPEREGQSIGPYQLLQKLGEGGFGVVYMAEQTRPVRRKVAIKIIKPGMESSDIVARFEAERQALAMMNHPNIASVLDGGCTPSGRPYFVMELVRGVSITEYCDKKQLRSIDRLRLFMDVCSAIQHAHRKGIIHRDLKPSNVMVTLHDGQSVVKVIDFGVAKAINQQLTEKMYFTRYGQMVGTPQYMSPEQAEMSGLGIDTLSDVYSLGVLLYELLVGMPPLSEESLREAGYKELQRLICDEEATRPSQRLSTRSHEQLIDIAAHRGVTPDKLAAEVSGDLEWIVMKTLEKDRDRRYSTPLELARDLQRFLDDQPVEARPPTLGYRVSKYVRRHRGPVAATAAIGLILIGTSIFSSYMWQLADRRRDEAMTNYDELQTQKEITEAALAKVREQQEITQTALTKSEQLTRQLEQQLYRVRIKEASELLAGHSRNEAKKVLAQCPEGPRDWEFDHLNHVVNSTRGAISGKEVPMFTDRNDRLVCVSNEGGAGKIQTWNADNGERLGSVVLTAGELLNMAAMHPDHRIVAAATDSGDLFLVDLSKQAEKRIIWKIDDAHTDRVDGLGFSPDGSTLASAGWDGWIRLWDVETGRLIAEQNVGEGEALRCAEFDPTGRFIAAAAPRKIPEKTTKVRIWNARTLEIVKELMTTEEDLLRAVCFSPTGNLLATGGSTGAVLWNTRTWEVEKELPASPRQVHCVRFSTDGNKLAVTGRGFLQFWDVRNQQLLEEIAIGTKAAWWGNFSPDGQTYAYFQGDEIRVRDLVGDGTRTRDQVVTLEGRTGAAFGTFSIDGTQFAAGGINRAIMVWDTVSGKPIRISRQHKSCIMELEWDRAGRLVSRDVSGFIQVWDENGERLWDRSDKVVLMDPDPANIMAIQPSQERLFLGTFENGILVLDMESGLEQGSPFECSGPVTALASSPDGRWLAWCDNRKGTIRLWDLQEGKSIDPVATEAGHLRRIAFSPDSKRLAVMSTHRVIEFDVSSRQRLLDERFQVQLWSFAYSSSGRRLFVCPGGKDKTVKVMDTSDGSLVLEIPKHGAQVAFDPNRKTLACLSFSGRIQLHETRTPLPNERTGASPLPVEEWLKPTPYEQYQESRTILFENKTEQYPQALELATEATQTIPDCAEYELIRGVALYRQGQIDHSLETLQKVDAMNWNVMNLGAIQQDTLEAYSHAIRAMAYHQQGSEELAREHLSRVEQLANNISHSAFQSVLAEARKTLDAESDVPLEDDA